MIEALDTTHRNSHCDAPVDVSLIICTRDRCQQLRRCLKAVAQIKFAESWELVIVDNGSTDNTFAVINKFANESDLRIKYVFEATPGLSNAHNAALRAAGGTILAFTDDDCYPSEDFLSEIWNAFTDASIGYIGGRILLHDPTDFPATINESVVPRVFPERSYVPPGTIQGANMAFRKLVLLNIGGFDPDFGPGAAFEAEDLDAVSRASGSGWGGLYCPRVVVRHHHGRKAADIPALAKFYAIGRGAWQMKLLLREHRVRWFLQSAAGFPRRLRWEPRTLWEFVGAWRYLYLTAVRVFRDRGALSGGARLVLGRLDR